MKVYILLRDDWPEGDSILGVFSDWPRAYKAGEREFADAERPGPHRPLTWRHVPPYKNPDDSEDYDYLAKGATSASALFHGKTQTEWTVVECEVQGAEMIELSTYRPTGSA